MKWYCLKSPEGEIRVLTIANTKRDVWSNSFWAVANVTPGFRDKYWKRFDASLAAAKRLGWQIVEVKVVEA